MVELREVVNIIETSPLNKFLPWNGIKFVIIVWQIWEAKNEVFFQLQLVDVKSTNGLIGHVCKSCLERRGPIGKTLQRLAHSLLIL